MDRWLLSELKETRTLPVKVLAETRVMSFSRASRSSRNCLSGSHP